MSSSQPAAGPAGTADFRTLVIVCYLLFLLAAVNGLTAVIGVVIAHAKRRDVEATIWQGHFDNLILVFWVFVAAAVIAMLSWPLGLLAAISAFFVPHGAQLVIWPAYFIAVPVLLVLVIFPVLVVWYLYRTIRGLIRAAESLPYRH